MSRYAEAANAADGATAGVIRNSGMAEQAHAEGYYTATCYGPDGAVKWTDDIHNLVLTAGKNHALDNYLAGSAYTATWFMGLVGSTSFTAIAAADTAASHAGWTEETNYSAGARPTAAFSAAASGAKALSAALTFTMSAGATVKGAFLVSNSTKGGTTGTIYSAGLFTGGDKVLASGDSLAISYSASL